MQVKDVNYGKTVRKSYAKYQEILQMPNLLKIQKDSYDWFLREGLHEVFRDVAAISDYTGNLELSFLDYSLDEKPKYTIEECKERDATYAKPIKVRVRLLNKQSGVLALSNGLSSDFRDLEAGAKEGNEACQLALDKFCYEVRKYIGAYAAALGGLDCLVFTAGVGENGCTNRAAICEGLEFLGVKLDPERNKVRGEEALISADDSRVKVWVIPTNEELMIAQDTAELCKK